ncbi:hypothetical protein ASH01_07720 [Terrabacter sp. Soil811]|uniref:response regulator n=1 Tax=Terrabacter sp. Soil811 TaxID=1736419 RepID=UPI0006FEF0F4|nr:response regulator transcription factor [Terrabacter sp. Soil811]KRF45687.1 hypothetical protein ASH01_07720 [Terrabacter sp. Soil811]
MTALRSDPTPQGPDVVRVLVVDDVHILRIGLASLFSLEGDLELCGAAESGEQAVEVARRTHPDVVLMDIRMPGIGGVEATRRILQDLPTTQVVVLTGEPSVQGRRAALEAGAAAYIVKDAVPSTVLDAVRGVGRGRQPGIPR